MAKIDWNTTFTRNQLISSVISAVWSISLIKNEESIISNVSEHIKNLNLGLPDDVIDDIAQIVKTRNSFLAKHFKKSIDVIIQ